MRYIIELYDFRSAQKSIWASAVGQWKNSESSFFVKTFIFTEWCSRDKALGNPHETVINNTYSPQ